MPDYRRYRVPGSTYFFTLNLLERRTDLLVRHIEALREAVARTRAERPFHIDGWVVLPDHIHCMLILPNGDNDFSNRIKAIKIRFVRTVESSERRSSVRVARGERGIWQRRFWEHAIRDQDDYARHIDYLHYNPVKHGYVAAVVHWPYSTFHRWMKAGVYPLSIGVVRGSQTLPLASVHDSLGHVIRRNAHKGLPPYAGWVDLGSGQPKRLDSQPISGGLRGTPVPRKPRCSVHGLQYLVCRGGRGKEYRAYRL